VCGANARSESEASRSAHASAAAIERRDQVMRLLPSVPRSRRHPQPQSPHRRGWRTRTAYSVRMACIGSTDAARRAGVKLATITTSASSAQAMAIVAGSNAETP
jgi:hypothetical protein